MLKTEYTFIVQQNEPQLHVGNNNETKKERKKEGMKRTCG